MPKAALFALVAAVEAVVAALAFRRGRIVIPVILMIAAICFGVAAIGQARSVGRPKIDR